MSHSVAIMNVENLTHDVKSITVEKPEGYTFDPGQATEVAIDRNGWREETRPFTFTSLPNASTLEFVIKIYPDHNGVTEQMDGLSEGDRLLVGDPWGAIKYRGPGYFIAGGAGVTPFIAIMRDLEARDKLEGHTLLFSNKTERDIILRSELEAAKDLKSVFTVTDEAGSEFGNGMIDKAFLEKHVQDFDREFYVCGPPAMVEDITQALKELGAEPNSIVFEQ